MLTAAAVCPHPPLLVPELASGAAAELDDLRAACVAAVAALAPYDVLYVVGADIGVHATSFAPWGVDVRVDVPEPLPLSVLIGASLTRGRPRSFVAVDPSLDSAECAALGAELAASADRVALLVMGDGSARHDVKAPGYVDDRAAPFDQTVRTAFAAADWPALRGLDQSLADELLVAGRAPWQVLAGAATSNATAAVEPTFTAPYGVGYHVAAWTWR
ncbi:MAG: hypothetical protein QOD07_1990 [Frankiaceae bacterium]|nr:hypothetical protein [Frankiaceae bacterium]